MSKKANPTTIGLFFAIGLALMVVALVLFSSRSLFHPRQEAILYFDSSLKGLNPGAAVKFRGVTIGAVTEIMIRHNQASNDFSMPVIIAIDEKLAQSKSDEQLVCGTQDGLNALIGQGFRGRLDAESLVTGVLYVSLDIVPNAPKPVFHQLEPDHLEIPTLPSDVERVLADLTHLDIRGISEKVNGLLTRLDTSLSQVNFSEINAGVTNLLSAANQLISTPDLTNSLVSLRQTLNHAQVLLRRVDYRVDPLADGVTNTLFDAQKTLADLRVGVRDVSELLGPDSVFRSGLIQAVEELGNASRAIAEFADFLQRNPNALLSGRKRSKEQP